MSSKFFSFALLFGAFALSASLVACDDDDDKNAMTALGSSYEAVDLGLSVKWASCNLGAQTPYGRGDLYAWGETEVKSTYTLDNYKYANTSNMDRELLESNNISRMLSESDWGYLTKYCPSAYYGYNGYSDRLTRLEPSDDVAHVKLGGAWRMPTDEESWELVESCHWEKMTSEDGIDYFKIVGPSGNSIILPYYRCNIKPSRGSNSSERDSFFATWASEVSGADAYFYPDDAETVGSFGILRFQGLPVRPVLGEVTKDDENHYYFETKEMVSSYGKKSELKDDGSSLSWTEEWYFPEEHICRYDSKGEIVSYVVKVSWREEQDFYFLIDCLGKSGDRKEYGDYIEIEVKSWMYPESVSDVKRKYNEKSYPYVSRFVYS